MPRPNRGPRLHWLAARKAYYIVWYERGQKRVRATGTTERRQAEAALARFIGVSHAPSGPRSPENVSVNEALSIYAELQAPKTRDPQRIGYAIAALLPFWGDKMLSDITPSNCDRYAALRKKAPGTVRRELAALTAAQNLLVRERRLERAVDVPLPAKPSPKDRWLTVSEAARLLNAARNAKGRSRQYLPLFIMIALYTGARKEAIMSLRWSQIDMKAERIRFALPGVEKTKKRRPTLPIPRRLMTFLRLAWKRRSSDLGPVLHIGGLPILRVDKGFRAIARSVGLDDVTPHTLRHTRGTWLAQAGVPMWDIAGWLGDSPETVSRIYAHHSPDYMNAALAATDKRK